MSLNEALALLAQHHGLPPLTLDEQGNAAFVTGDGKHVELHGSPDGLTLDLAMAIGSLRAGPVRALLVELLRANTAFLGLCSPCFALAGDERELLLTVSIPVESLGAQNTLRAFLAVRDSVPIASQGFSEEDLQMN